MEIVKERGTSILSTTVQNLVKSTGRRVGYILKIKSLIQDLNEEAENLKWKQEQIQHEVDRAIKDTEEIEEDVQKWLRGVGDVVRDVENLEKEIREKKTCLSGWFPNWIWKYQLAKKAKKKKNIMLELRDSGKFDHVSSHRTTLPGIIPPKDFIHFESNLHSFNQIIEALKDDKINVVGLYGTGGVGKTTLARAAGDKTKEEKIFDKVVMVVVTKNPDIKKIQRQIADLLNFKLRQESIEGRARRLYMRLKNEKKILIILDDIWAQLDLTSIGIPVDDHHEDCKIFLTTRRQQVCIEMGCQSQIQLDVLNETEGLSLLKRQVGLDDDSPTLIELAKEVAKECKGLPLAIVITGSALKEKAIDEWKIVIQKLKKSKLMDVDIVDVEAYACLKLSYDYLKNEKTKSCFLLCSLFPEDDEIDMEDLLRYGVGLGLYHDTDSIEEARSELRVIINNLIASSLLLDAGKGCVKMHDVVRDVALWITLKGEDVFLIKAGMGLTEWPKHEGLGQCTAISLGSKIEELPDGLVCPKLKILLLGSYSYLSISKASDELFENMKALKVVHLRHQNLSLNSLQSLVNLVTLQLNSCNLRDISSLQKLVKLEILCLYRVRSNFVELPEALRELIKLRMLFISACYGFEWNHINFVIPRLSRLEELCIHELSSKVRKLVEGTSAESSKTNLSELSKQPRLTIFSLSTFVPRHLPKNFIFPMKLLRYDIRVNGYFASYPYPEARILRIFNIEATSLVVFNALYETVECLELKGITGHCQNIVPSIDETGLNAVKTLSISKFDKLECIIDMMHQQVPSTAFSHEGLCYTKENPFIFSSLASLTLDDLPNLRYIWKGPTQKVSLQSLTVVIVYKCHELRYLFTLTLARSLLQLEQLTVMDCNSLEHIVAIEAEENVPETGGNGNVVVLPKLRTLKLESLESSINFCSENYFSTWPALQEVIIHDVCSMRYVTELEAKVQTAQEESRALLLLGKNNHLCNPILPQRNGLQNLERLEVSYCEVQVIFQLNLEQEFSLSSLKDLELGSLDELEYLFMGTTHLLSLPNLTNLELTDCNRLTHLFSFTFARNLLQLESIVIRDCNDLEQIIVEDQTEDHEADMKGDREIVLPKLRLLNLQDLESLVKFCPSGYHLMFPSLSELVVEGCFEMTTRFSIDQNGSVRATAKALQTGKEDVDIEQSPLETIGEINCRNSDDLRKLLPPYIGK